MNNWQEGSALQIDEANRTWIQEQESSEQAAVAQRLQQHTFPWTSLVIATLLVFAATLFVRWLKEVYHRYRLDHALPDPISEGLQALQKLEHQQLPSKGLYEAFYVELTSILRRFVERKYGVKAGEATSDKIIGDLLLKTDPVKFGLQTSSQEDCHTIFEQVRSFISRTEQYHAS